MRTLRLVLGDQLNENHSWFKNKDENILYTMMEMRQETDYVTHHIQKVIAFFRAMRHFSEKMSEEGHKFIYLHLDDKNNKQDLVKNLNRLILEHNIEKFEYLLPDEYRLDEQLSEFVKALDIKWEAFDTEHFLTGRMDLEEFFNGKKTYLMESFYRHMRKKYDIMMEGDQPETGKWNYDASNRKSLPKKVAIPNREFRSENVLEYEQLLRDQNVKTIGSVDSKSFIWPQSRAEAIDDLDTFCETFLQHFGTYQDAMHTDHAFIYHSLVSFSLNSKLLHPLDVVNKVIFYWRENDQKVSIEQVEGFVRQIIGWREFMRGIYWSKMPEFANRNFFNHQRKLPAWYWDGNTKMNCLHHAIDQSLKKSYAHHIQRLMVTGNFALLAGIHPDEVDQWYLGIYIDAIEWVEITNTRGMSQFADGGIVGTKPYVSSSNYIKKMSNYCSSCYYSPSKKTGEKACPFNSLYWHFYDRHRDRLEKNPRIGMMYRTWDRMDQEKKEAILDQAERYLNKIEEL